MQNLTTISLRIPCYGLDGCQKEVDVPEYNITEQSLERLLKDDPHLEMSTLFGVTCPVCHSRYAFKPSRLKSMIYE